MTAAPLRRRLRLAPVVLGVLAAASWLVLSASLWLPPVVGVVPAPVTSLLVRPSYDVLESLALNVGMAVAAVGLSIAALLTTARNWVTVLLCGLVVVAALDLESRVSEAITRASRVEKRRVAVDPDALAGGAGAAPAPA